MATRVSFVIVNWGQPEATAMCVESVKAQRGAFDLEIIIVDNESTPASRSRLELIKGTILLAHPENRGSTGGMNSGFAIATGDYVAALNNDLVLSPDWLAMGVREFTQEGVGIVGGVEYLWNESNPPLDPTNSATTLMRIDAEAGYSYHIDEPTTTQDVYALDGNNMLFSKEVIESLGGFDNDFYMYYEDADLCARALALGYRVRYCAEMMVWHRRNLSSNRIPYRRQFLAQRNHLVFVARHFPAENWRATARRLAWQYVLFGVIGREAGLRRWNTVPPIGAVRRRAHLASGFWGISHMSYLAAKREEASMNGQRSDAYVTRLRSYEAS